MKDPGYEGVKLLQTHHSTDDGDWDIPFWSAGGSHGALDIGAGFGENVYVPVEDAGLYWAEDGCFTTTDAGRNLTLQILKKNANRVDVTGDDVSRWLGYHHTKYKGAYKYDGDSPWEYDPMVNPVDKNSDIGTIDNSGGSNGPHLHIQMTDTSHPASECSNILVCMGLDKEWNQAPWWITVMCIHHFGANTAINKCGYCVNECDSCYEGWQMRDCVHCCRSKVVDCYNLGAVPGETSDCRELHCPPTMLVDPIESPLSIEMLIPFRDVGPRPLVLEGGDFAAEGVTIGGIWRYPWDNPLFAGTIPIEYLVACGPPPPTVYDCVGGAQFYWNCDESASRSQAVGP